MHHTDQHTQQASLIQVHVHTIYSGKYWGALNLVKQFSQPIGEIKFGDLQVHALPIRVCDILIYARRI